MHYFYPCYFIIRRLLVASIYANLKDDGFLQLLYLSLLSGITLAWFTSYQPFDNRLRNILATVDEVAYLSVCITIFPYVYPYKNQPDFNDQAVFVVGFFLGILFLSMLIALIYTVPKCMRKATKHPVFVQDLTVKESKELEDARKKWTDGEPKKDTKKPDQPDDQELPIADDTKPIPQGPKINEKGGLETEEDESGSEESSEDTENSSESNSSDSDPSPDQYAQMRRIPQAEVNIDGYSTGFSGLRETQIQQFREREKQMF